MKKIHMLLLSGLFVLPLTLYAVDPMVDSDVDDTMMVDDLDVCGLDDPVLDRDDESSLKDPKLDLDDQGEMNDNSGVVPFSE
jgi:hypothetical protein